MSIKRKFCYWLYKGNEKLFADLMVKSFYEEIPTSTIEPVMDFFANNRAKLEKFFTIQAYYTTLRSISDTKKSEFYSGMLFYMKVLISMVQKGKTARKDFEVSEPKVDELKNVNEFISGAKKLT